MLLSLDYTAQHGQELLKDFYEKSKRSVAKATTEGPAAWAIVNDGRRPALAAQLANLLQRQGAEVQKLEQDFEVKENGVASSESADAKRARRDKRKQRRDKSKDDAGAKKTEEAKTHKASAGQLHHSHGPALQPHGGHAARHAVLLDERSASLR